MYASTLHYNARKKSAQEILGEKFNREVQYDFTRLLFIGVQSMHVKGLDDAVELASSLSGYHSHRTIQYKENICHIYVKYVTTTEAKVARDFFQSQGGFYAELVDDILKGWYIYEKVCEIRPRPVTVCYLEVVGEVAHTQPLTEDTARSLLMKFGKPVIQFVENDHVRVAFSSIAAGIGACIVYGKWFVKHQPQDFRFYYRVQLEKSDHFAQIINSNASNKETFQLEYFSPRSCPTYSSPPLFTYENTSYNNGYMAVGEPRYSRQFYRGRDSNKYRGNKNNKRNSYPNKFRNVVYPQATLNYSQIDQPVGVQYVSQTSDPTKQNATENFQCR